MSRNAEGCREEFVLMFGMVGGTNMAGGGIGGSLSMTKGS